MNEKKKSDYLDIFDSVEEILLKKENSRYYYTIEQSKESSIKKIKDDEMAQINKTREQLVSVKSKNSFLK